MKNIIWSLFALLILTGTSCQESVDIEAEKQLIKDKSTAIIEAEQQKDLNATLSYYAEDVILQVSNTPQTQGLEALRNFLEGFFKVMVSIEGGLTEVTVSEAADMAWDNVWYRIVINGPDGPIEEEGKYLEVWEKINGEWKCLVISISIDETAE